MEIKVVETNLDGVLTIEPEYIFEDYRGEFVETYNKKAYHENGIDFDFVQDDISVSYKNVFRGIHGDDRTIKLVTCHYGRIFFVVVNCERESNLFGGHQTFILSDKKRLQVLIPPNYGIGYLALSDMVIFHYKQSHYYEGMDNQFSYRWDDARFKIKLPIEEPILSERDRGLL